MCQSALAAGTECDRATSQEAIEELRTTSTAEAVYLEDGAGDGTVLVQPYPSGKPLPSAERIIRCAQEAGPELIGCLDDSRETRLQCRTERTNYEPRNVPLGFVCLDILLALSQSNATVNIADCEDDGFGACIHKGFYFRPDDYEIAEAGVRPLPTVYKVKKAWVKLLKAGRAKFTYPAWLRRN